MDNKSYNKLSIINVKNKLNLKEGYCNGNNIFVYCPFCNMKNRDKANLKLNIETDSYYCNCCGESGYAVGLYAKLNYIDNKTAFKRLMNQDADITSNLQYIQKAIRRTDEEISMVYEYLLKMLGLSRKHFKILSQMGFSREEIVNNSFKSIPQSEHEKIKICERLIKCGFKLQGIPGFYLNEQMKWTFKSHKGFFVPVIYDREIKGLRIHLDEEYKMETTDIWFSSKNEYQGSSTKNAIMIFVPETERKIEVYNKNNITKKDVIIATEFLMGYRLFNRDKKITIAIPNRITKVQAQMILNTININKADIYIDNHTIAHDCLPIYRNLLNYIDEKNQNINFIFDYKELISKEITENNIAKIA